MNIVSTTEETAPYIPAKYDIHKMLLIDVKTEVDKKRIEALMEELGAIYDPYEERDEYFSNGEKIEYDDLALRILVQKKEDVLTFMRLAKKLRADFMTEADEDAALLKILATRQKN